MCDPKYVIYNSRLTKQELFNGAYNKLNYINVKYSKIIFDHSTHSVFGILMFFNCHWIKQGSKWQHKLKRDTHLMQQFIYYYKQLYMFRSSICPSSGVLGCIHIILLHMVSSTRCCGWGSEEPVCSLVHWCKFCIRHKTYTSAKDYKPAPQNLSHNT